MSDYKSPKFILTLVSALMIGMGAVLDQNVFSGYPQAVTVASTLLTVITAAYTLGHSFVEAAAAHKPNATKAVPATSEAAPPVVG